MLKLKKPPQPPEGETEQKPGQADKGVKVAPLSWVLLFIAILISIEVWSLWPLIILFAASFALNIVHKGGPKQPI